METWRVVPTTAQSKFGIWIQALCGTFWTIIRAMFTYWKCCPVETWPVHPATKQSKYGTSSPASLFELYPNITAKFMICLFCRTGTWRAPVRKKLLRFGTRAQVSWSKLWRGTRGTFTGWSCFKMATLRVDHWTPPSKYGLYLTYKSSPVLWARKLTEAKKIFSEQKPVFLIFE